MFAAPVRFTVTARLAPSGCPGLGCLPTCQPGTAAPGWYGDDRPGLVCRDRDCHRDRALWNL